jgi:hypothetical protein
LRFFDRPDNCFSVVLVARTKFESSTIELLVQHIEQVPNRAALSLGVPDRDKRVFFIPLQKMGDGAAQARLFNDFFQAYPWDNLDLLIDLTVCHSDDGQIIRCERHPDLAKP